VSLALLQACDESRGEKRSTPASTQEASGALSVALELSSSGEHPLGPDPTEVQFRSQMFAQLVTRMRQYHVFSDVWPEAAWERELPALEREVLEATDRAALLRALHHLGNSLRDAHLSFKPRAQSRSPAQALAVGFTRIGDAREPRFVAVRADAFSGVSPGDVLLEYDGVQTAELLTRHRFDLTYGTAAGRADQLARLLGSGELVRGQPAYSVRVPLRVQHGEQVISTAIGLDQAPLRAAAQRCPAPDPGYGHSYELVDVGAHVCLYRASEAPFSAHPIVRQLSFMYALAEMPSDRERIAAFLATEPKPAGVVLDLRENRGGNSPEYFLDWYAPGPYRSTSEWIALHPELTDRAPLKAALRNDAAVDEYLRRTAAGERWWVRAFDCGERDCAATRIRQPEHGVTRAPIALLLGTGCHSACDQFAAIWIDRHFGPTIGVAPTAMYTSLRFPLQVELADEPLGELSVAFCGLRFEGEAWLEGRELSLDRVVEPSWPADAYAGRVVEVAVDALRGRAPSP
jgi:hypothetical protein